MIRITISAFTPGTPNRLRLLGTIVVEGDDIVSGDDDDLLDTVRGRSSRAEGRTFEDRVRAAYPYWNGYVVWDVTDEAGTTPGSHAPEP